MICAALGSVNSTLTTDTISLAGSTNGHGRRGKKEAGPSIDGFFFFFFLFWTHSRLKRSSLPAVGAVCAKKTGTAGECEAPSAGL